MSPDHAIHWKTATPFALIALIFVSAFAASSETAFFSLNRFQLRRIKERYRVGYDRIRILLSHPSRLLIMILLINEVVNVAISSIITEFLQSNVGITHINSQHQWFVTTVLSMVITIPTLLLFGEITPKVIAAKMNRLVAIVNSRILIILYRVILPLLWVMDFAISFVLRKFKAEGRDQLTKTMSILSEEDFMILMEEGHREGTVDPSERKLIQNVLEFDDSLVSEVMTPINQAFSISAAAKIADVLPEIRMQKYSRIPVYNKNKRNIAGILYVKDLLALRDHPNLRELEVRTLMTRPLFIGPNMRLSLLFRRFKESKMHMAVVLGASPRTATSNEETEEAIGVVTMEDVLESIFGEIADERDMQ